MKKEAKFKGFWAFKLKSLFFPFLSFFFFSFTLVISFIWRRNKKMEGITEGVNNLNIMDSSASNNNNKKNRIQVSNTKKPLFFYVNLAKVHCSIPFLLIFSGFYFILLLKSLCFPLVDLLFPAWTVVAVF